MLTVLPVPVQMATAIDSPQRTPLAETSEEPMSARTVPILTPTIQMSAPSPGDPMDIATPTNSSAPASATKSPTEETNGGRDFENTGAPKNEAQGNTGSMTMPAPAAAAAAVHQPKIVQTAFIHKLYK